MRFGVDPQRGEIGGVTARAMQGAEDSAEFAGERSAELSRGAVTLPQRDKIS